MQSHTLFGRTRKTRASRRLWRGFTMVESLMATVVFSFGAIGVAGMQNLSMQSTFESMQRTQAIFLASDLIERLRNNAGALDSYDDDDDADWTKLGQAHTPQTPSPDCISAACSAAQLAAYDLWAWDQAIDGVAAKQGNVEVGGLVSPTGCIRHSGDGRIELAIAWRGRRTAQNAALAPGCTDSNLYGTDDENRHVLVVRTYVAAQ